MTDQLITFETSVLAKTKGFDIDCLYKGLSEDKIYRCTGTPWIEQYNPPKTDFINIPTQSVLQRWLRDVHGIEVYVLPLFKEKCGYDSFKRAGFSFEVIQAKPCQYLNYTHFQQCWEERNDEEVAEHFNIILNEYELALEKGLQEGLKLIDVL